MGQLTLFGDTDIISGDYGRFTRIGWTPPDHDLTDPELCSLIEGWGRVASGSHFILGDLIAYAADKWQHGQYENVIAQLPIEKQAIQNIVYTCRSVKTSSRDEVLSFSHHRYVAPLPDDKQRYYLSLASENNLSVSKLRRAIQQGETFQIREITWPDGQFPVIYADPPWRYEFPVSSGGAVDIVSRNTDREIENQYPTMELEEIKLLPVETIAADDCILFLWATSPKLAEAMEVIEAWGFTYRTNIVWDKERIGMGYYARQQHELLLIAAKGNIPAPVVEARIPSVVRIKRDNVHSRKPDEFYSIIESMYPNIDKVELFSRTSREGWETWGNQ